MTLARRIDRLDPLFTAIESVGGRDVVLVGIGGHGAAGKSTLANAIRTRFHAQLVTTDAFWDGQQFALGRITTEVLEPLLDGQTARYGAFDWATKRDAGIRAVEPTGVIVVEGVCALHQMFRDNYDLRVWVDTPEAVRLDRGVSRDGEQSRHQWTEVWIPNEDAYVERDRPIECAHIVFDGMSTDLLPR